MPNMIWLWQFLGTQLVKIKENSFPQDNQSAIKIEENGRRSSGQKIKHMDNIYFWMKDRIKREGIKILYCPTEKTNVDFFTKPLQGSLFRKFRKVMMGEKHISTIMNAGEDPSREDCVGN